MGCRAPRARVSTCMNWRARSPGMNRIEHEWDCLQRRMAPVIFNRETRESLKRELVEGTLSDS